MGYLHLLLEKTGIPSKMIKSSLLPIDYSSADLALVIGANDIVNS